MEHFYNFINAVSAVCWDYALPIALIITGLFLTIILKGRYAFKLGALWHNSIGTAFKKSKDGGLKGTVSSMGAAMVNLGNTVGTGNISGVASALVTGGPGAIFWMWVIAIVGMATKSGEIILGLRYRVKFNKASDEYMCNRDYVMGRAMGWKVPAAIFAFLAVFVQPLNAIVQTNAIVESIDIAFGLNKYITIFIVVGLLAITILGGLKRITKVAEKVVPFMCALYILAGLVIIVLNIKIIPSIFGQIFKYAFTPMAGVGGAVGFSVANAFRYGCARGVYSNDSGIGAAMCTYGAAKSDHPGRTACWGWGENFIDTIVVCTITALAILVSNTYIGGEDYSGAALAAMAFGDVFGVIGKGFIAIATTLFAWTTLSATFYQNTISLNYLIGDRKNTKWIYYIWVAYFCLPQFLGTLDADFLWVVADFSGIFNIVCTVIILWAKHKDIAQLGNDFFERYWPKVKKGEPVEPVEFEEAA